MAHTLAIIYTKYTLQDRSRRVSESESESENEWECECKLQSEPELMCDALGATHIN